MTTEATRSTHTPGPWQVREIPQPPDEELRCFTVVPAGNALDDFNYIVDEIWHEPDARLIAAAPDLLAALEELNEYSTRLPHDKVKRCDHTCSWCQVCVDQVHRKAAKAIAAARGEASDA